MKFIITCLATLLVSTAVLFARPSIVQPVNALLEDVSFLRTFGSYPTSQTNEHLRIRTHLAYVERLLRQASTSHLSPEQQHKRSNLLNRLHDYWVVGRFPINMDYRNERRPCFIDKFGNICAVGYLIEQDAGRAMAEFINAQHKYEYITTMNTPELMTWVEQSGLSFVECAMIQPTYPTIDLNMKVGLNPSSVADTTGANDIPPYDLTIFVTGLTHDSIDVLISLVPVSKNRIKLMNIASTASASSIIVVSMPGIKRTQDVNQQRYIWLPVTVRDLKRRVESLDAQLTIFLAARRTTGVNVATIDDCVIYPNPCGENINIDFEEAFEEVRVNMLNLQGNSVLQSKGQSRSKLNLDVSTVPTGAYLLEVMRGKKKSVYKILKN